MGLQHAFKSTPLKTFPCVVPHEGVQCVFTASPCSGKLTAGDGGGKTCLLDVHTSSEGAAA